MQVNLNQFAQFYFERNKDQWFVITDEDAKLISQTNGSHLSGTMAKLLGSKKGMPVNAVKNQYRFEREKILYLTGEKALGQPCYRWRVTVVADVTATQPPQLQLPVETKTNEPDVRWRFRHVETDAAAKQLLKCLIQLDQMLLSTKALEKSAFERGVAEGKTQGRAEMKAEFMAKLEG